jgi:hypothetical protein
LRGRPVSQRRTVLRHRPSRSAAESPAGPPPTMMASYEERRVTVPGVRAWRLFSSRSLGPFARCAWQHRGVRKLALRRRRQAPRTCTASISPLQRAAGLHRCSSFVDRPRKTEIESNSVSGPRRERRVSRRRPEGLDGASRRDRRPRSDSDLDQSLFQGRRARCCRTHRHGPPLERSGAGGPMNRPGERNCPWPA